MQIGISANPAGAYQMFYRHAGHQGPAVVLLHGIPTHSFLWQNLIPELATRTVVLAPDLVGYGQSAPAPVADLTLPRQADHILALLDTLGIRQAHFVGHDLGGGIAQILAVRHPERVLSLALVDPVCFSNWPIPQVVAMRWPTAPEFEPGPALVQQMLQIGVYHPEVLTPEVVEEFTAPYSHPQGPEALQRAATALEHHQTEELVPDLGRIRVPVTILWGQHDRFLPAYWGLRLQQAIPRSRFQVLPECGHFGMLDNPALLARELMAHLEQATLLTQAALAAPLSGLAPTPRAVVPPPPPPPGL